MRRLFATMVDVSAKAPTHRTATATGTISFSPAIFSQVAAHGSTKGDLISVAKVAGIQAAKRTSFLLPLCHNLPLEKVEIGVVMDREHNSFVVTAEVRTSGKTGVEMEALTAVSTACLTLYDMTKSYGQEIQITDISLQSKTGGKTAYERASITTQ